MTAGQTIQTHADDMDASAKQIVALITQASRPGEDVDCTLARLLDAVKLLAAGAEGSGSHEQAWDAACGLVQG